jgi:hypothetical protein
MKTHLYRFIVAGLLLPLGNLVSTSSVIMGPQTQSFSCYGIFVGFFLLLLIKLDIFGLVSILIGISIYAYGAEMTQEQEEDQRAQSVHSLLLPLQWD